MLSVGPPRIKAWILCEMLTPLLIQNRQDGRERCSEMSFSEVTIWLPPSARRNRRRKVGNGVFASWEPQQLPLSRSMLLGEIALFLPSTTVDLPLLPFWTADTEPKAAKVIEALVSLLPAFCLSLQARDKCSVT